MPLAHHHALSTLHIPPAQHPVTPSTDEQVSPLPPCSRPPPPLANRVPSGLHATLATLPLCPCSRCSSVPSEASHRHTLPSSPQLANRVQSGLQATPWKMVSTASGSRSH